ncbi:MAG: Minichromosome maintenance protein MCM, partial [Nitrososphaerota archaeon]
STVTITARQLESLIRLAEARARVALRDKVTEEDAGAVVLLMKRSLQEVGIDVKTGKPDIDVIMTGKPKSVRDKLAIVLNMIKEFEERKGVAEEEELKAALVENGLSEPEINRILSWLITEGKVYTPKPGCYKVA